MYIVQVGSFIIEKEESNCVLSCLATGYLVWCWRPQCSSAWGSWETGPLSLSWDGPGSNPSSPDDHPPALCCHTEQNKGKNFNECDDSMRIQITLFMLQWCGSVKFFYVYLEILYCTLKKLNHINMFLLYFFFIKFTHLNKKNRFKAKVMKFTGNLLTILQNLKNLFLVRAYGQLSQRCRTGFGYVEKIKI